MITFGYNSKFSSPLRALLFIAFGVLMIVAKADAMQIVVKIIATFMLAAGIVSIVIAFKQKKDGLRPLSFFNAAINILVSVLLFSCSGFVAGFVSYLLGLILLAFGLFQIFILLSARSKVSVGIVAYLVPLIVAAVGGMILFIPNFLGQSLGIITGGAMIVYGISDLVSAFKVRGAMEMEDEAQGSAQAGSEDSSSVPVDAKEVEYEKVDEQ